MVSVLVIDDEPQMRSMIRRILSAAQYIVTEAQDGRDGLECLVKCQPSIVITDIYMPNMEGIETIREIRRRDPATKIVVMSGGGSSGDMYLKAAQAFGADVVLQKPFRAEELLTVVSRLIAE